MKKILLFPGCFDPFHIQHKVIIETFSKDFNYEELWILINQDSKQKKIISNFNDRLEMIKLNIKETEKVKIIKKPIGFYTEELIKELINENKNCKFYLILGTDQVNSLLEWKKSDELPKLVNIVAIPRETFPLNQKVKNFYNINLIDNLKINNFNSTAIKIGENWDFLTKESKNYIIENNLYFENILKNNMGNERFEHSVETAKLSKRIINLYGFNKLQNKVYTTGLLHDLTKEWNENQHLNFLKKINVKSDFLKKLPFPIWHGKTSALFLKYILKINDSEIIDAINFHTTARKEMKILDMVLYIADKFEISKTGMTFDDLKNIFKTKTLEEIFKQVLFEQTQKIKNKNLNLTKDGKEAFNFYF